MSSASLQRWEYRDTAAASAAAADAHVEARVPVAPPPPPGFTEEQLAERIRCAVTEAEQRWAEAAREQEARRREQMQAALAAFAEERGRYFRQAESEVVHLAFAIARKILGREAMLDQELVAALVRIALDRMAAGPDVKLRVPSEELPRWQQKTSFTGTRYVCELMADPSLSPGDCVVETDLGTANFGLDAQFKEIEQGMLDLLNLRPSVPTPEQTEGTVGDPASLVRDR